MTGRYLWQLIALAMTVALAACGGGDDPPATTSSAAPAGPSLNLNWDPNTESDLKEYRVYRRTGSTAYGAPVATVPKGTTSFAASGLTPGVTYLFTVTAVDTSGNESLKSNEVSGSL